MNVEVAPKTNGEATGGPVQTFRTMLEKYRGHFERVLPRVLAGQTERMISVAMVAISRTPTLLACEPYSVLRSLMVAAQLGLDPSGVLGQGWLVPYWNSKRGKHEAQFIIGYRGLRELARRSGDVTNVEARVVYEKDQFEYRLGLQPMLNHVPTMDADPGKERCAYAIVWLKGAEFPLIEIMSHTQVDKVRDASRAGKSGPWVDWREEMARKTVMRKALNYAPLSTEAAQAVALADSQEADALPGSGADAATVVLGLPELPPEEGAPEAAAPPQSKSDRMAAELKGRRKGKGEAQPTPPAEAATAPAPAPVSPFTEAQAKTLLDSNLAALHVEGQEALALLETITGKAGTGLFGPDDYTYAIAVTAQMRAGAGLKEAMENVKKPGAEAAPAAAPAQGGPSGGEFKLQTASN